MNEPKSYWSFGKQLTGTIYCKCDKHILGPECEDAIVNNGRQRHGFNFCSFAYEDNTYGKDTNSKNNEGQS